MNSKTPDQGDKGSLTQGLGKAPLPGFPKDSGEKVRPQLTQKGGHAVCPDMRPKLEAET